MDKTKKKRLKQYLAWISLAVLVLTLAVMPLLARQEAENDGPVASILETTAEKGSIETVLRGGGTLSAGKAVSVKLPSGVKIREFLVKNGDTVTEGTPVARVDQVSLMNAIVQVQETLDYLRDEIADASDDTVRSTITAKAGGYVKEVYAQKGDSVQDVMLRHGALAVLSLDGRMAVKLTRNTVLAAGDTVLVGFEDGSEAAGRVESSLDGVLTVSLEDRDYPIGAKVTVTTEDGDRLGSGELYVHNAWKVTGYTGTVSYVNARENRKVSSGATLFTLTDTDFTGTRDTLASLHREYEELLQEMFQMYESGVITAPGSGLVSGVDEDSPALLSAPDARQGWFVDLLSNPAGEDKTWTVMLLGSTPECDGTDSDGTGCKAETHVPGCYFYCTGSAVCTAKQHKATCLSLCVSSDGTKLCTALNHKANCLERCESCKETGLCPATGVHKSDCIESCTSSDGTIPCPATGTHKADCLGRCDKTEGCTATVHHHETCLTHCDGTEACPALNHKDGCYMSSLTYKAYAALVEQVGEELVIRKDASTIYTLKTGKNGWELVDPATLKTDTLITPGTLAVSNPSAYKAGDVILVWTGYLEDTPVKNGVAVYTTLSDVPGTGTTPGGTGGFPGMGGFSDLSGLFGSMGGMGMPGNYGAASGSEFTLFDLEGQTLMTVTEAEVMTLNISIDEQDIARISLGQTAQVEIAALKGRSFQAEVTEIGTYGTNSGGSSKFTVELTLDKEEDMLAGMNATAAIGLSAGTDILVIPTAALVETETGTVVYTALDPKTGDPISPVSVTTGLSDGEKTEILQGLNPGDKVYYSYYDVLELDHTAKTEFSFR